MTVAADPARLRLDRRILAWLHRAEQCSTGCGAGTPGTGREAAVRLSDRLAAEFTAPAPEGVVVEDRTVAGPGGPLLLRLVRPPGWRAPGPTQLWLHGGGFVGGSVRELVNVRILAARAVATGIRFAALEYRLAPEHPYPAAVEDALAALRSLTEDPSLGADPRRLGVGGNSAGGGIAASVVLRARDEGRPPLRHQALEVPAVALRAVGASAARYGTGFGLDEAPLLPAVYLGPGPGDAYAEPWSFPDLAGLPPALVHVAEHDPLRDAGTQYAARLSATGVPVELVVGAGQLHGSPALTAATAGARAWQHRHAAALRAAYRTSL